MDPTKLSFTERGWLKTNIKYAVIGILIGLIISLFTHLFRPAGVLPINIMLNVLFGLFITLSITNVIVLTQRFFTPSGSSFWKFIGLFYVYNFIGLFIGTELSYLIVSQIFNERYQFVVHAEDYKVSSIITLIIGTLILLYQFQKINTAALLKSKEINLVKLNQLKTAAELQALQAKINPHFLYNALNSIASLIHEDAAKAEDMTLKLSKLFRYSINTMEESFSTIKEELEILDAYLAIEKIRFGNRIDFKIEVLDFLLTKQIPRFLLQPLVENALKHGLKNSIANGQLKVKIEQIKDRLIIFVSDNGIPFPEELSAGYGLQSTFDKLKLLYKEDYDIQLNNTPEKHIKISIPLS